MESTQFEKLNPRPITDEERRIFEVDLYSVRNSPIYSLVSFSTIVLSVLLIFWFFNSQSDSTASSIIGIIVGWVLIIAIIASIWVLIIYLSRWEKKRKLQKDLQSEVQSIKGEIKKHKINLRISGFHLVLMGLIGFGQAINNIIVSNRLQVRVDKLQKILTDNKPYGRNSLRLIIGRYWFTVDNRLLGSYDQLNNGDLVTVDFSPNTMRIWKISPVVQNHSP